MLYDILQINPQFPGVAYICHNVESEKGVSNFPKDTGTIPEDRHLISLNLMVVISE